MIFVPSKTTAALCASARPSKVAPVLSVIAVVARMIPLFIELEPKVALLPTAQ